MNTLDTVPNAHLSRRTFLKGAGAGAVGFTMAQIAFLRSAAAESEELQELLDITVTTEHFGVTALGAALASDAAGNYDTEFPDAVRAIVTAAQAQEQFHLEAFEAAGGRAITKTFTIPEALATDYNAFFSAVVELEAREQALQMVGMRIFAEMRRPDLAKVSYQYSTQEAEHRVLANYARGARPANNLAFERELYDEPSEHIRFLEEQGLIGGDGIEVAYPGPVEIDPTGVINRAPDGPAVACAVGMPGTGGGALSGSQGGRAETLGSLGLLGLGAATAAILSRRMTMQRREVGEQR